MDDIDRETTSFHRRSFWRNVLFPSGSTWWNGILLRKSKAPKPPDNLLAVVEASVLSTPMEAVLATANLPTQPLALFEAEEDNLVLDFYSKYSGKINANACHPSSDDDNARHSSFSEYDLEKERGPAVCCSFVQQLDTAVGDPMNLLKTDMFPDNLLNPLADIVDPYLIPPLPKSKISQKSLVLYANYVKDFEHYRDKASDQDHLKLLTAIRRLSSTIDLKRSRNNFNLSILKKSIESYQFKCKLVSHVKQHGCLLLSSFEEKLSYFLPELIGNGDIFIDEDNIGPLYHLLNSGLALVLPTSVSVSLIQHCLDFCNKEENGCYSVDYSPAFQYLLIEVTRKENSKIKTCRINLVELKCLLIAIMNQTVSIQVQINAVNELIENLIMADLNDSMELAGSFTQELQDLLMHIYTDATIFVLNLGAMTALLDLELSKNDLFATFSLDECHAISDIDIDTIKIRTKEHPSDLFQFASLVSKELSTSIPAFQLSCHCLTQSKLKLDDLQKAYTYGLISLVPDSHNISPHRWAFSFLLKKGIVIASAFSPVQEEYLEVEPKWWSAKNHGRSVSFSLLFKRRIDPVYISSKFELGYLLENAFYSSRVDISRMPVLALGGLDLDFVTLIQLALI